MLGNMPGFMRNMEWRVAWLLPRMSTFHVIVVGILRVRSLSVSLYMNG